MVSVPTKSSDVLRVDGFMTRVLCLWLLWSGVGQHPAGTHALLNTSPWVMHFSWNTVHRGGVELLGFPD